MSFFFLFTQQQKERKRTKKKEKPKQRFLHPHEYTLVRLCFLFGYAESLQPRKLGHSTQTMLGKKLIQIFYPPSSALQAPSPVKGEGWYLNTAERQAKRLARLRVRACPSKQKRLS